MPEAELPKPEASPSATSPPKPETVPDLLASAATVPPVIVPGENVPAVARSPVPVVSAPSNAEAEIRRRTRRAFTVGTVSTILAFGGWKWLKGRSTEGGLPWPFRRVLDANGRLGQALYSPNRLAPTFPESRAVEPRINGQYGLTEKIDLTTWKLQVEHEGQPERNRVLTLADLAAVPRIEMVSEMKCIEGWSVIVQWSGYRFADLLAHFNLGAIDPQPSASQFPYISLETPDQQYYVSLDMASMLHPQTILCDAMNHRPLTQEHGSPLRLITPLKYGIKNIKRIGTIRFTRERPRDFWASYGYDWYAGL